jgi:hypothetical protein
VKSLFVESIASLLNTSRAGRINGFADVEIKNNPKKKNLIGLYDATVGTILYGICTLPKPNYRPGNRFVIFFSFVDVSFHFQ